MMKIIININDNHYQNNIIKVISNYNKCNKLNGSKTHNTIRYFFIIISNPDNITFQPKQSIN